MVGYAFSTFAVTGSTGFSGKPLDVHVGLTPEGRIAGAFLAAHEEPILVIGVSSRALESYVAALAGIDVRQPVRKLVGRVAGTPDHVAGATVSSAVIKDAVLRSARAVASSRGLLGASTGRPRIERALYQPKTFRELLDMGAVVRREVTRRELAKAPTAGNGPADGTVVELYLALLTPPTIGQNLLGRREHERLEARLAADQHAVLIAANGLYSFKGTAWRQSGAFDRFQLVQGATTIRLTAHEHDLLERLAAEGAPELREIGVFRIPASAAFDPVSSWRLELLIEPGAIGADGSATVAVVEYKLPQQLLAAAPSISPPASETSRPGSGTPPAAHSAAPTTNIGPAPPVEAVEQLPELWQQIWRARTVELGLTLLLLIGLTIILFSHDLMVRDVARYRSIRIAFLVATFAFLGLYAGAQLSIVHVVTFTHALLSGFRWEQFLLDPLIFVLWSFVALALLFWGRGVFCGWLCPFGALQELVNEAARKLGIKQIEVPWALHERLWPIKYVAFLLILGVSLKSATQAFVLAEIEPFKTAITLKLMRAWPFVLYVLALLAAGLFIERFYCRYLCPLGAALAIPARLRLFEWLKRRPQCGRECRICATTCPVQAINPIGQIVPNECIYCLQCQANYYDVKTCLPLIQRAQRRKATPAAPAATQNLEEPDDD